MEKISAVLWNWLNDELINKIRIEIRLPGNSFSGFRGGVGS